MSGAAHFSTMDFQSGILAGQDGPRITAVHSIYIWQSVFLHIYLNAIWTLQHACNLPAFNAKCTGGTQPHILCDLLRQHFLLWAHGR